MRGVSALVNVRRWTLILFGLLFLIFLSAGCSRTCPKCHGAGTVVVFGACPRCKGTGTNIVTCPACEGACKVVASGVCPYCGGRGAKECTFRKTLTVPGNTCYIPARNTYALPTIVVVCRSGRLEAENRDDAAKYAPLDRGNPNRICPVCFGSGVVQCSVCNGLGTYSGERPCETCRGTGHLIQTCPECSGERVIKKSDPCPLCKGKGTLSRFFD